MPSSLVSGSGGAWIWGRLSKDRRPSPALAALTTETSRGTRVKRSFKVKAVSQVRGKTEIFSSLSCQCRNFEGGVFFSAHVCDLEMQ